MRWILMGWDDADTIIPLLDTLKELEQGQRYPATKAIMSFFNPNGSNARAVCSALSSLNGMTPPGKDALTRVLQVQEADSKAVAEVLLAGWLSSTGLNEADKSALRVVAGVIGLRIPGGRGVPSATSLHATSTLQTSSDLPAPVKRLGASTEALLSWAYTSYRGFLTFATGVLKIPSMPSAHQFVLANTFPTKKKFTAHGTQKPGRVVFHSTSLDHVYAILCEGLKICDGQLQKHGAAHGQGIYTAEDPSVSLGYSRPPSPGWRASNC